MVKVQITAREVIRHCRTLEIPDEKFAEYEAMVGRHQESRVPDSEWERAFGDYLIGVDGYEGDSDGLEDLEITNLQSKK